jgi:hypothetical protein
LDITFALSIFLTRKAVETPGKAAPFLRYASRWANEQESFFVRHLAKALPEVLVSKEYQSWEARQAA